MGYCMKFFKDTKAQGSLEYLLIIGGVIVIVAIVGYYIKTKVVESQDTGIEKIQEVVQKASK